VSTWGLGRDSKHVEPEEASKPVFAIGGLHRSLHLLRGTLAVEGFQMSLNNRLTSPKSHAGVHMDGLPKKSLRYYWKDSSEAQDLHNLASPDVETKLTTDKDDAYQSWTRGT
jgi:hypothetical protein